MAETGTQRLHVCAGEVGDVVVVLEVALVSPPLAVDDVKHYFGGVKGFPAITELIRDHEELRAGEDSNHEPRPFKSNSVW